MSCLDINKLSNFYIKVLNDKMFNFKIFEKNESIIDMIYHDNLYLKYKKITHEDIIIKMNNILKKFSYENQTNYICFNKFHVIIEINNETLFCPFSNKNNSYKCNNHKIIVKNIKNNNSFEYNYLLHHLIKEHNFFFSLNPETILNTIDL